MCLGSRVCTYVFFFLVFFFIFFFLVFFHFFSCSCALPAGRGQQQSHRAGTGRCGRAGGAAEPEDQGTRAQPASFCHWLHFQPLMDGGSIKVASLYFLWVKADATSAAPSALGSLSTLLSPVFPQHSHLLTPRGREKELEKRKQEVGEARQSIEVNKGLVCCVSFRPMAERILPAVA